MATLRGAFNPAIVHPAWLEKCNLIRAREAADAKVEVVNPAISIFSVGEFSFVVEQETFQIEGRSPNPEQLRDLVVGTFRVLEHTPVKLLAITRHMHFQMEGTSEWHRVGHKLAPKEPWESLLDSPGTVAVRVAGRRPGSSNNVTVGVEPSVKVANGVYIGVGESFEVPTRQELGLALDVVAAEWVAVHAFGKHLAERLLERCLS